jgi:hypothetical protein
MGHLASLPGPCDPPRLAKGSLEVQGLCQWYDRTRKAKIPHRTFLRWTAILQEAAMRSHRAARALRPTIAMIASCALAHAAFPETIEGIWSTQLTIRDHPGWKIEDLLCARCPLTQYRYLQSLLADRKNDQRSLKELDEEAARVGRQYREKIATDSQRERLARYEVPDDLATRCEPPHLVQTVLAPMPLAIDVSPGVVTLHQHFWNDVRRIAVGDAAASRHEPQGGVVSSAYFDGDTLVVESRNVPALTIVGTSLTDGSRIVERYMPDAGGQRLDIEVTIENSESFREPLVLHDARVNTPNVELFAYEPCGDPFVETEERAND